MHELHFIASQPGPTDTATVTSEQMRVIFRKFRQDLNTPTKKLVFVFLTLVVGFAGPFGTYVSMSPLERLFYWGLVIGSSILLVTAVRVVLMHQRPGWSYWKLAIAASCIFALIYATLLAWVINPITGITHYDHYGWSFLFMMVLVIAIAVHGIRYFTMEIRPPRMPRILERLPEEKRGRIIRLTARDHFVDVYTDKGMYSIRIRFADAVNETEGVDGICVHRSHWVAIDAICAAQKANGRISLLLCDGTVVPVSRKYHSEVRSRGIVKDP